VQTAAWMLHETTVHTLRTYCQP